jgi:hypothetical protein
LLLAGANDRAELTDLREAAARSTYRLGVVPTGAFGVPLATGYACDGDREAD